MRVVVCAKQIPEHPDRLDPDTYRLIRDGRPALDGADAVGVELAVRLAGPDDEVVLVSMGPGGEAGGLRSGLALGAARAVLVSDPALAGADALTTAKVLAAVVRQLAPVDLVLAGTESTDGYTGVLASQLAGLLDLPAVTFARRLEVEGRAVTAERQTEAGHDDVTCPMPCLVSLTSGAAVPHYPSFKAIVGAKSKPVEVLDLGALDLAPPPSAQEVVSVAPVEARRGGEVIDDDGHGHERIVDLLVRLNRL